MGDNSLSTDSLKAIIQSHLAGLHGTTSSFELDELDGTIGGYVVKGKFSIPWGKKYSFEMRLTSVGQMESYKRKEIPE